MKTHYRKHAGGGMTAEEYWAAIRHLGLRPSNVGTVYLDANGTPYHVQNPDPLPPRCD
jgi:hypothetical protein